jgi:murein DD-endopeptidase
MAIPTPPPLKAFWGWPTDDYRRVSFPWNASLAGQPNTHHAGSDVPCPVGTPLRAMTYGTVHYVGEGDASGKIVQVQMIGQMRSWNYQHCQEILVSEGESVHKGQVIARSGQSGNASVPMVHIGASISLDVGSYANNSATFDVMRWCLSGATS